MVQVTKWIVLRGLGRSHGHWGSFQNKMRQAFPNDEIYFLDLPGNGDLNQKISPVEIRKYVPFLRKQLKATSFFETSGPVYGVGLSLGGMVMTEWVVQGDIDFKKIFLINTSASNFSGPWRRISPLVLLTSVKQLFAGSQEIFELNSLKVTTNFSEQQLKAEFKEDLLTNIEVSLKYPIHYKNIIRQLIAAAKYFFPVKINTEVILINGAKDRFVNPKCSEDIQKKWGCKLMTHPTAGHDIAFADGAWLINVLKSTLLT